MNMLLKNIPLTFLLIYIFMWQKGFFGGSIVPTNILEFVGLAFFPLTYGCSSLLIRQYPYVSMRIWHDMDRLNTCPIEMDDFVWLIFRRDVSLVVGVMVTVFLPLLFGGSIAAVTGSIFQFAFLPPSALVFFMFLSLLVAKFSYWRSSTQR